MTYGVVEENVFVQRKESLTKVNKKQGFPSYFS